MRLEAQKSQSVTQSITYQGPKASLGRQQYTWFFIILAQSHLSAKEAVAPTILARPYGCQAAQLTSSY